VTLEERERLRALAERMRAFDGNEEDSDFCVACEASTTTEYGLEPTPLCNLCAQSTVERVPELLDALDAAEKRADKAEDDGEAMKICADAGWEALEVARDALDLVSRGGPFHTRLARAALEKLPPRRTT